MGNDLTVRKRFWAKHKAQIVLRLFRGEDLELVSRDIGVTAAELSEWRDTFLEGGESGLKPRPAKESIEVNRLQSKIGEQAMEIELLREKIARMEKSRPLASRRSRK
jgi:hypothetical protein